MKIAGSIVALGHLGAVALLALAAQNGPWPAPAPIYRDMMVGPKFATEPTANLTYPAYLKPLHMTHNYHFASNDASGPDIQFEVRLKDDLGVVFETLKFPDEKAHYWTRHRQSLLARGLGNDQPVQPPGTERVPAKGMKLEEVEVWDMTESGVLRLKMIPKGLVPSDRTVVRPSDLAKELAQSYMRYLCRKHNAASAELIRYHRDAIPPVFWFIPGEPPAEMFIVTKSHFGEFRRGK